MKLRKAHIREFKSILDSNEFEVGDTTCLVGKNEAGKTALLQALYRLHPIVPSDGEFDVTDDYPRADVADYIQEVEDGKRKPATVVEATFTLEADEIAAIEFDLGPGALASNDVCISRRYPTPEEPTSKLCVNVRMDEKRIIANLLETYSVPGDPKQFARLTELAKQLETEASQANEAVKHAKEAAAALTDEAAKAKAIESAGRCAESEQHKALRARVKELAANENLGIAIWQSYLDEAFPRFLYFDEYYTMNGHENIDALVARQKSNNLRPSDHPMLGLIGLANLKLEALLQPKRTQELKNKLQAASNHLTKKVLQYWSQNKHLRMSFDVRPALSEDPEEMRTGTNIWGEIEDQKHLASTGIGTRSAGFVWFFSFLAWYSSEKKKGQPLVLLLDEPGTSLHGKAQADLLRYFEAEIESNPKHQLIYTTHSPFMVDAARFDRVRIVEDRGIDSATVLPKHEDGTKVFTDVLEAGPDSLFPLHGALGCDLQQTLFIGPNCLVVEGVSDLLFIQTLSAALQSAGRTGLDARWVVTPVGGSDKVPTFAALLGAQQGLKVATLIDFQKKDRQSIENIYKRKLLEKSRVLTYAEFVQGVEADVEDMFDPDFYVELVADEFGVALKLADLTSNHPRITVRLEQYFKEHPLPKDAPFNHYRPARRLASRVEGPQIPASTLDRFEAAFSRLNEML